MALKQVLRVLWLCLSVSFHQCLALIFILILLLSEGQTGEVCECSKSRGALGSKVLSLFFRVRRVKQLISYFPVDQWFHHYKYNPLMFCGDMITVYCENHTTHTGCICNAWTNFRSEFSTPKRRRNSYECFPQTLSFRDTAHTHARP